jgi:DNA-3-methyladenine glycosylase II
LVRIIATEEDIADGLAHLARADPRLRPAIAATAGSVPVRRREAGFAGLVHIIVSQQLSAASAEAIWRRVEAAMPELSPATIIGISDQTLRSAGLSGPKIRTVRAAAAACSSGLDLDSLAAMEAGEASAALTAIKGIGPWSAEIYLLFCLGNADVLPAGDLALRIAAAAALGEPAIPSPSTLAGIAAAWSPWRGVAACLLWAYYRTPEAREKVQLLTRAAS